MPQVINNDLCYKLGVSIGVYLKSNKLNRVVIGRDNRLTGESLSESVMLGICTQGIDVVDVGVISTPALIYIVKNFSFDMGIMVTASHNGPEYNGIKIVSHDGVKSDAIEQSINELYDKIDILDIKNNKKHGKIIKKPEYLNKYIDYIKSKVMFNNTSVCFDCANGATSEIVKKVFYDNKKVSIINDNAGDKINIHCGATDIASLKKFVIKNNCDLGCAFDGDGDRITVVSRSGKTIDGDDLLYFFSRFIKTNVVVGTIMTNFGLERALSDNGVALVRTNVGDKNILGHMLNNRLMIGGEQSGHIILRGNQYIGDGIAVAIELINLLENNELEIEDETDYKKYPQVSANVEVDDLDVINTDDFLDFIDTCESLMLDSGRIVVRASGTEPVVRVMIEGEDEEFIKKLMNSIVDKIKSL